MDGNKKNNPRVWRNYLGTKVDFENCPILVKEAIKEEWSKQ